MPTDSEASAATLSVRENSFSWHSFRNVLSPVVRSDCGVFGFEVSGVASLRTNLEKEIIGRNAGRALINPYLLWGSEVTTVKVLPTEL